MMAATPSVPSTLPVVDASDVVDEPGEGPACDSASTQSYGHSGYTGTLAWVDPAEELVFVFLSNRVHPNQGNYKLISENIRTVVQQVVYDAITDE